MWAADRRGFTLLEVLVASSLMLLLMGLVSAFLLPGMRTSARGAAKVEMQQQAVLAVQRVADELQRSVAAGIGLLPVDPMDAQAPVAVGIVRLEDVTAEGQQVWSDRLRIFYWDRRAKKLYARAWPPAPPVGVPYSFNPAVPERPGAAALKRICEEPSGSEAVLAFGVDRFEVTSQGTGVASPLTVLLEVSREIPGTRTRERFAHTQVVALRNSL